MGCSFSGLLTQRLNEEMEGVMTVVYIILTLLFLCEIGQWVINHYVIKALNSHNESFKSVLDIIKLKEQEKISK